MSAVHDWTWTGTWIIGSDAELSIAMHLRLKWAQPHMSSDTRHILFMYPFIHSSISSHGLSLKPGTRGPWSSDRAEARDTVRWGLSLLWSDWLTCGHQLYAVFNCLFWQAYGQVASFSKRVRALDDLTWGILTPSQSFLRSVGPAPQVRTVPTCEWHRPQIVRLRINSSCVSWSLETPTAKPVRWSSEPSGLARGPF